MNHLALRLDWEPFLNTARRFYSTEEMEPINGMGYFGLRLKEPFLIRRVYVKDSSGGRFEQCVVEVVVGSKLYVCSPVWLLKSPDRVLSVPVLARLVASGRWAQDWSIRVRIGGGRLTEARLTGKDPDLTVYLDGDPMPGAGLETSTALLLSERRYVNVICSQCGQPWPAPACGPSHAVVAWEVAHGVAVARRAE